MKSNLDKYIKDVIDGFQANRGKASVYCIAPISYADLVVSIINQLYVRSPGVQVFIVVDCFNTRKTILEKIALEPAELNVKVLSSDFVKPQYKYDHKLIITVGVNDDLKMLEFLHGQGKFMLAVLTKNIMNNEFIAGVREILPDIQTTVSHTAVMNDFIYLPVEEYRKSVIISEEDMELYKKYNEYINTSISIFGNLDAIDKCRFGDPRLNISAAEVREGIARSNGWNETLDTTLGWGREIDDTFNPNILLERANTFYNITRERKLLVTDNVAKLETIRNICLDHWDKKVLIVSKRGDYAAAITKYINESTTIKCGNYHDTIEPTIAVDMYGQPVLIKSGKSKGEPKIMGAQAISTLNMSLFNNSDINVLSIKNSSNVKLKIAVDIIIYTTPFIDGIVELKSRFSNIDFKAVPTIMYKVYCSSTIENKHLNNQKETPVITIIEDDEDFIGYDESNGDIIL